MEFVKYLRVLRRRWRVIAVLTILGLAAGLGTSLLKNDKPPVTLYKGTNTLTANGNKLVNLPQLGALATETEITRRAAARLNESPAVLAAQVSATAQPELDLLKITAVNSNPTRAVQVADTFAEEVSRYQVELSDRARDEQIKQYERQKADLAPDYQTALECEKNAATKTEADACRAQRAQILKDSEAIDKKIDNLRAASSVAALTSISTAEPIPVTAKGAAQVFSDASTAKSSGSDSKATDFEALFGSTASSSAGFGLPVRSAMGAGVGFLIGVALVLTIERLDPRVHTKADAEDIFGWPVLAEIPPFTRDQRSKNAVIAWEQPRSRVAEAYRALRSAVLFASSGSPASASMTAGQAGSDRSNGNGNGRNPQKNLAEAPAEEAALDPSEDQGQDDNAPKATVVMVSSASPAEGKTTTSANLAAVLAEANRRVLVVNCDFRRPRIHDILGAPPDASEPAETQVPNVWLINKVVDDIDHTNPAKVVQAQRSAIEAAKSSFDYIVLDTAPLLSTNDATDVLAACDVLIIVARTSRTDREAADRAAELLERRAAPVLGVVLVAATDRPGSRYYYYGESRYYTNDSRQSEKVPVNESPLVELEPAGKASRRSHSRSSGGDTPPGD